MIFNQFQFYFLFAAIWIVWFVVPSHLFRLSLLLASSYVIYASIEPTMVVLLFTITSINYLAPIGFEKYEKQKKLIFWGIISANLGLIAWFKYYLFLRSNLALLGIPIPHLDIILPVGISFYTFQAMSYSIDTYYQACPREKSFLRFALFVSFFPQLVSGPIVKAKQLLPQFHQTGFLLDSKKVYKGIKYILIGLVLKVVIADNLAHYTIAMNNPQFTYRHSFNLLFLTYSFMVQMFGDFAGYSLIAIGLAQLLGYQLPQNFQYPFLATGFNDFWRRWHITLTQWLKDYVFLRLNMRSLLKGRILLCLFITFLISGLWHGANWNFIAWGGLHGIFCCIDLWCSRRFKKLKPNLFIRLLLWFITLHMVCFAGIFFYHSNISTAIRFLEAMFIENWNQPLILPRIFDMLFFILPIFFYHFFHLLRNKRKSNIFQHPIVEVCALSLVIIMLINLWGDSKGFIYFQF